LIVSKLGILTLNLLTFLVVLECARFEIHAPLVRNLFDMDGYAREAFFVPEYKLGGVLHFWEFLQKRGEPLRVPCVSKRLKAACPLVSETKE
jgi:hypothetical protein